MPPATALLSRDVRHDRMRRTALVLAAVLAVSVLADAPPAVAASCPAPGGRTVADAAPTDADFTVLGHGWGHGVGLSQYGAEGAARLGCSAGQILRGYYQGVRVRSAQGRTDVPLRVGLTFSNPLRNHVRRLNVDAVTGSLPWQLCTSGGDCRTVGRQAQGRRWQARVRADGSFALWQGDRKVWAGGNGRKRLRVVLSRPERTRLARLTTSNGHAYRWGHLQLQPEGGRAFVTARLPSIERYLRGLAEMPSSWQHEALKAQAIVGRVFALHRRDVAPRGGCACDLLDSTYDQHYTGYDHEDAAGGDRWVDAVQASADRVIRYDSDRDGRVTTGDALAVGYYSSSHGGASESSAFVWGGATPYLQAVDDSRWDKASPNPLRSWAAGLRATTIGDRFGVGVATSVTTPTPRGLAGRVGDPARGYGGVVVKGTTGTVRVSGERFRAALGLRSTLFRVVQRDPCAPPAGATFGATTRSGGGTAATVSVRASRRHWPHGAKTVLLAGAGQATATLGAPALAARRGAPLLLTHRDRLDSRVADELRRLKPRRVLVLGNTAGVSRAVARQVAALVPRVSRVGGDNRWQIAANVARRAGPASDGRVVLVAGGATKGGEPADFALSAAGLAAAPQHVPVVLTRTERLPPATAAALRDLGARTVLVAGGTRVVSRAVTDELERSGYRTVRRGGDGRYGTSVALSRSALRRFGASTPVPLSLAAPRASHDTRIAGVLATRLRGLAVLSRACDLDKVAVVSGFLDDEAAALSRAVLVGPRRRLSDRVRWQVGYLIAD